MLIEQIEKIEHIDLQNRKRMPDDIEDGSDISFFSAQLDQSKPTSAAPARSETSNLLAEMSTLLNNSKERSARRFKAISKNKNLEELRKLPAEFSQTILTSQLLVKSLGKTTQSIEKICNLQ